MTRRETESYSGSDERGRGISYDNNNNGCLVGADTLEHHSRKVTHLTGLEDKERNDWRVSVTVDDEAQFAKTRSEVSGVESDTAETLAALGSVE